MGPSGGKVNYSSYEASGLLGSGAFSDVFYYRPGKATSPYEASNQKKIAVKIIREMFTEYVRVAYEVEAMKKVGEHSNVVQLLHVGKNDTGQTMLYMELCQEDLEEYAKKRAFSSDDLRDLVQQVASGLNKIHAERMVHRDLKPQNILVVLVDGKPMFKITDFGLVFIFRDDEVSHLVSMSAVGTRVFMAPEMLLAFMGGHMLKGQPYKVDIFSLGVVIYQIVTKNVPFNEAQLISPTFDPRIAFWRNIQSQPLQHLLKRMLQKAPNSRPHIGAVLSDPFVTDNNKVSSHYAIHTAIVCIIFYLQRNDPEIIAAANAGDLTKMRQLEASGANLDFRDNHGNSALKQAAYKGHEEVVHYLLENRVNIDGRDNSGCTPLYSASLAGRTGVVHALVKEGASVDSREEQGRTPLWIASFWGHSEAVALLVNHGSHVEAENDQGFTALHMSCQEGHLKTAEALVERAHANIHAQNESGYTPFYMAALKGHVPLLRYLLRKGADMHCANSDGRTPLWNAASAGQFAVARYLVAQGASVNKAEKDGFTPLHIAAQEGHLDVVKLLVEIGRAENSKRSRWGTTALGSASRGNHDLIVQYLKSVENA